LTSDYTGIRPVGWSSDGRTVYFQQTPLTPGGTRTIATRLWNGGAPPVTVVELNSTIRNASVGPAHTYLAMAIVGDRTRDDIWVAPLDSLDKAIPLVATAANETMPRVSPDGQQVAYVSDESGVNEVYIRTVLGQGTRVQVSTGGGTQPEWGPNGREILFRGAEHLLSASLATGVELAVTRRDTLFSDVNLRGPNGFQVFPNGREFLLISSDEGRSASVTVVLNWQARLKKP
jgi:Tol biopolymer transport system component